MTRALVIDDAARKMAADVLAYAKDHPYEPERGDGPPGDQQGYIAQFGSFRAVFSFTHHHGGIYRHLSVSVPGDKYPHPIAIREIANLFGFTGAFESAPSFPHFPPDWMLRVDEEFHCIVVAQAIGSLKGEAQ